MAEPSLKERCIRRLDGLKKMRQPYEGDWKEVAALAQPARSRFLASDTNKNQRQTNKRLHNGHGIKAFRTLQNGMTAGLSSGSRPWFMLRTYDEGMMEDPEIKAWFSEVERRMYAFIASTNFYGAVKTGYLEMGLFGTEACVALEHRDEGMVCHALTAGEFWIALNDAQKPGALYRSCSMTALQAVQLFGGADNLSARIKAAYDNSRYEESFEFFHAIEENDELEEGRLDWRGKPWRSIYWEADCGDKDKVAAKKGYEEQPFWAPRWDTTGWDAWGNGPGHDALPDLRELQLQSKRKAEATDMHVWPEKIASASIKLRNQPKSVVTVPSSSVDLSKAVSVPYQIPYQTIEIIRADVMEVEKAINEASFADLFMAITNMQGIQPRNLEEIASRNEEKMSQLGPVIERVNNEKLEVAIDRVFGIMQRGKLLPPAPEKLRDSPGIKVEFISILTQMQRMVGIGPMERVSGFVGQLAALYPQARHKIDVNELIDEYSDRAGAPPKIIVSTKDANAAADAEAQAMQNEKLAEAGANMAPAVKDLTDAAALAAEVPGGGVSAIDALLPQL